VRPWAGALALAGALGALLGCPLVAQAAFPSGKNGKIAFQRNAGGDSEIFVMNR
jgi:hypothetical protein